MGERPLLTPDYDRGLNPIRRFIGTYFYLSNFAESPIAIKGVLYPTVEHAFQAMKAGDHRTTWLQVAACGTPAEAKRFGRRIQLRPDWEEKKTFIMHECLRAKFASNPGLGVKLDETGDRFLEEGNNWGDREWGTVDGAGANRLGFLLMFVRTERRLVPAGLDRWGQMLIDAPTRLEQTA